MGIIKYKPTSPGRRFQSVSDFAEITSTEPVKSLLKPMKRTGGRNSYGRITARFIGGGHKRKYRVIDFCRNKADIPAKVATIEYDPNRSARIALLNYRDGEKRYIVAPAQLNVGDVIVSGEKADIKPGNAIPLKKYSSGISDSQRGIKSRAGCAADSIRGSIWPVDGERRQLCAGQTSFGRSAENFYRVHGHHRSGRQQ